MSKNYTNPTKVITGVNTRWSYANVWDAKSINGGTPKYSVSLIIPKVLSVLVIGWILAIYRKILKAITVKI